MIDQKLFSWNGEPKGSLTEEQWDAIFGRLYESTRQSRQKYMLGRSEETKFFGAHYIDSSTDDGIWERYCQFINDVLRNIRKGETDYCYFVYQIADLLQFEHERLIAKWMPRLKCFCVHLASEVE